MAGLFSRRLTLTTFNGHKVKDTLLKIDDTVVTERDVTHAMSGTLELDYLLCFGG